MVARFQVLDGNSRVRILEDIVPERRCIRGRILLRNAVEVEYVVPQLDGVARQTDDSFHQPGPIDWRIKNDDVAANGVGPGGNMQGGERDFQVVGEFVYENQLAL